MSFAIRDKFAREVPEDLADHTPTETPEDDQAPAGDYSADVTPPPSPAGEDAPDSTGGEVPA